MGPSSSSDGRFVAFVSSATNLVAGDGNGVADVFVRDVLNRRTTRVVGIGGAELNGVSTSPAISGDGRTLVFVSAATNVIDGDVNTYPDLFALDVATGAVRRLVDAKDPSLLATAISTDGSTVAFTTREGLFASSLGEEPSFVAAGAGSPSLSANGRFVAFTSGMRGLAPGDGASNQDVFVFDRHTRTFELASGGADGSQPNAGSFSSSHSLSADGRVVTFISVARLTAGDTDGNADVYVRDRGA
ncbi:MAG: hypothetical protein KY447_12745, partial [Actinobacteria bacterium]|nr:hypothetical protein [Actinomycetota bacterium]